MNWLKSFVIGGFWRFYFKVKFGWWQTKEVIETWQITLSLQEPSKNWIDYFFGVLGKQENWTL